MKVRYSDHESMSHIRPDENVWVIDYPLGKVICINLRDATYHENLYIKVKGHDITFFEIFTTELSALGELLLIKRQSLKNLRQNMKSAQSAVKTTKKSIWDIERIIQELKRT